jgi:hypothetical protein
VGASPLPRHGTERARQRVPGLRASCKAVLVCSRAARASPTDGANGWRTSFLALVLPYYVYETGRSPTCCHVKGCAADFCLPGRTVLGPPVAIFEA